MAQEVIIKELARVEEKLKTAEPGTESYEKFIELYKNLDSQRRAYERDMNEEFRKDKEVELKEAEAARKQQADEEEAELRKAEIRQNKRASTREWILGAAKIVVTFVGPIAAMLVCGNLENEQGKLIRGFGAKFIGTKF